MKVEKLSFSFTKRSHPFFKDLSFSLDQGKLHALHGKNGTGKTLLLQLLAQKQTEGGIMRGKIISPRTILINQRFDEMIADRFTFFENLQFACFSHYPPFWSPLKSPALFSELISKFHIDMRIPAEKLSGGQRQILALLMILQKKYKILLLDEPTAALDEQNAAMVFEFLHHLKDKTLLIVCHDKELIEKYRTGKSLNLIKQADGTRYLVENN